MLQNFTKIIALSFVLSAFSGVAFAQTAPLDAVANESGGQYAPMNMGYAGFNSLGMTQSAWLDPLQNLGEGQTRPAYSKYYWSPDLVLPIRLREGMLTLINFPAWEMVEDVFIGDNATFDGQISGPNTVLLYPRKGANVGVDTNVIIFGRSGNRYVFYVKSEAFNTERITNSIIDIEVIGDDNSQEGKVSGLGGSLRGGAKGGTVSGGKSVDSTYTRRFLGENWLKEIPLDIEKFRFDIEVYVPNPEDVVIAPERVWRDDIFTYIDLGAKSLNMTQRPIVTLIVERMEVPVGFRTKGPNNRLIIVEAIGDMVLRNGKRIVCLKMRRSDDNGLEDATKADDITAREWDRGSKIPNINTQAGGADYPDMTRPATGDSANYPIGQTDINVGNSEILVPGYGGTRSGGMGAGDFDYSKMHRIQNNQQFNPAANNYANQYRNGAGFSDENGSNISIELGTDANVDNLENLWDNILSKYGKTLKNYDPFFSVDAPADGQGKELFHLRIGPVKTLDEGDKVCSQLGRNGVFCSVVRTQ